MAVTIFHRIINRVRIVNRGSKKGKIKADIKTIKHTTTEQKKYD